MIRYDKKINNQIRRIVNNFNAKVKRLETREDLTIPAKVSTKEIKEGIKNRADLNRKLKNLQEFTKRGGEQFNLSTYPTYEGKKEKFTIAQQFNEETRNIEAQRRMLLDVDYLDYSPSELTDYISNLESNAKTVNLSMWQQNYADMLLESGYVYNIPHARLHELREKILDLSPSQFDKLFKTESTIKQILYYYNQINELGVDVAYDNMESDVVGIYNSLFENIDDILEDYK